MLAARVTLIESHLGLVPPIARRVHRRLPPSFELDDLVGEGNVGLMQAAARYRPRAHGGTPFSAFARPRIHGAIVDSVRRRCWTENTACPLDDAPEPVQHRSMPFLIASRHAIEMPRRGPGRATQAFPQRRIPRRLYLALRTLPSAQRALLGALYSDGASIEEAARLLHIPVTVALARHRAALDSLREILVRNVSIIPSTLVFLSPACEERAA